MNHHESARAEADRRYPALTAAYNLEVTYPLRELIASRHESFVAGAEWAREAVLERLCGLPVGRCADDGCAYPEPHRHGIECDKGCACRG